MRSRTPRSPKSARLAGDELGLLEHVRPLLGPGRPVRAGAARPRPAPRCDSMAVEARPAPRPCPSSPPSMASSGSSGNRRVSARGTHGGSAMISGKRSRGASVSMMRPSRISTRFRSPAATRVGRDVLRSNRVHVHAHEPASGPGDGQQPDLAGPRAQLENRARRQRRQQLGCPQRLVLGPGTWAQHALVEGDRADHRSRWSRPQEQLVRRARW